MRKITCRNGRCRADFIYIMIAVCAGLAIVAGAIPTNPPNAAAAKDAKLLLQKVPRSPQGPDFALPDLDGKTVTFKDLRGKVVVVNFWATWCPPCRTEIPSMERAWAKLKDQGVVLLAIHIGGNGDKIWDFISEFDITFPVLIDKSGKVSKSWQTIGLPTTYVVDPAGRKVLRAIGGREWDDPALLKSILDLRKAG